MTTVIYLISLVPGSSSVKRPKVDYNPVVYLIQVSPIPQEKLNPSLSKSYYVRPSPSFIAKLLKILVVTLTELGHI